MITFLLVLIVLGLGWIAALEVRFHSLKNIAGESRELAQEALAKAEALLEPTTPPKPATKRKS